MTYHRIEAGLARLIDRSLDAEMTEKVAEWKGHLAQGRVNEEMKGAFTAFGWLSSGRDPRLTPIPENEAAIEPAVPPFSDPTLVANEDPGVVSPKRSRG